MKRSSKNVRFSLSLFEKLGRDLTMATMIRQGKLKRAVRDGQLGRDAMQEISRWLDTKAVPTAARRSIDWLIKHRHWQELNDRFYEPLTFGTGGLRGRTIGAIPTPQEMGRDGKPVMAAIGSTCMNDFSVIQATFALYRYSENWLLTNTDRYDLPKLVVAYDVRYFSRHFAQLVARLWEYLGGNALLFDNPRSTPELSFAIRHLGCTAGVVITASHNPFHDNGYKAYFRDGAQVVPPHASEIMDRFAAVPLETCCDLLKTVEKSKRPCRILPHGLDEIYREKLQNTLLDPTLLKNQRLSLVYSPLHGTGEAIIPLLLESFAVNIREVEEQRQPDPAFSTVVSPNPENPEAFSMVLQKTEELGFDLALATDPDGDRLSISYRGDDERMKLLSGNRLATALAVYRLQTLIRKRLLPANRKSAAFIKSFVTAPILEDVAAHYGVKMINTLIGFKWIGEKLEDYEKRLVEVLQREKNMALDYLNLKEDMRRKLMLRFSTYLIFAAEESCGFMANDRTRDKDGNAAALMVCELFAWLKKEGKTLDRFFREIFTQFGYFEEKLFTFVCAGADGAKKIQHFMATLRTKPLSGIGPKKVLSVRDFLKDEILDEDSKVIPSQNFLIYELENDFRLAIRPSGTEPKIKFYLFARRQMGDIEQAEKTVAATFQNMIAGLKKELSSRLKSY